MKITINFFDFTNAFRDMGRENQFSYDGLEALYNYLITVEEDLGQEIELDVIGLCCDYAEYENIKQFQEDYGKEYGTIEEIEEDTMVIKIDDERFIIRSF